MQILFRNFCLISIIEVMWTLQIFMQLLMILFFKEYLQTAG